MMVEKGGKPRKKSLGVGDEKVNAISTDEKLIEKR
jgi:hypothetical protein